MRLEEYVGADGNGLGCFAKEFDLNCAGSKSCVFGR